MRQARRPLSPNIREARPEDTEALIALRKALWPEGDEAEHRAEIRRYFEGGYAYQPCILLLAEGEDRALIGFAEASVRPFAEGCSTEGVAYLEGWFVSESARSKGVGRALVEACEHWGRSKGCSEFASDADAANDLSKDAHLGLGFTDVGLVRCFRKKL